MYTHKILPHNVYIHGLYIHRTVVALMFSIPEKFVIEVSNLPFYLHEHYL